MGGILSYLQVVLGGDSVLVNKKDWGGFCPGGFCPDTSIKLYMSCIIRKPMLTTKLINALVFATQYNSSTY